MWNRADDGGLCGDGVLENSFPIQIEKKTDQLPRESNSELIQRQHFRNGAGERV